MNTLNKLYMTMNDNFRHHAFKTILGLLAFLAGIYVINLGTCNVWRSMHDERTYSAEQYNIHADAPSLHELHYAKANRTQNNYKNQLQQHTKWQQMHIEARTRAINRLGLRHGVSGVTYDPNTHRLNVKFHTTHPTRAQQNYAQKLCNYVNE